MVVVVPGYLHLGSLHTHGVLNDSAAIRMGCVCVGGGGVIISYDFLQLIVTVVGY